MRQAVPHASVPALTPRNFCRQLTTPTVLCVSCCVHRPRPVVLGVCMAAWRSWSRKQMGLQRCFLSTSSRSWRSCRCVKKLVIFAMLLLISCTQILIARAVLTKGDIQRPTSWGAGRRMSPLVPREVGGGVELGSLWHTAFLLYCPCCHRLVAPCIAIAFRNLLIDEDEHDLISDRWRSQRAWGCGQASLV